MASDTSSTAVISPNPTASSSTTSSTSTLPPPTSTSTSTSTTSTSTSTSTSTTSTTSSTTSTTTSSTSTSSTSTTSTAPETTSTSTTSTSSIPPTTVVVTSTSTSAPDTSSTSSTGTITSTTSSIPAATTSAASSGSHGLSAQGTIAVAVVVPVVSVGLIICVLIWWWRRHKANKLAEEERRKEVEEYGFNPNNDPTLPGVGGAAAAKSNTYSDRYDNGDGSSGYRGWGTTSHPRNPSTNLSSGAGVSIPMSDTGSAAGYGRHTASPNDAMQYSDGTARPDSGELAVAGAAGANNADIRRGTSNASSAYSAGVHSEGSEDAHMAAAGQNHYYDESNPYYHDVHTSQPPYGDMSYGTAAPVIRDVQARRNTRIENAAVYPQQGNAGIAQNF